MILPFFATRFRWGCVPILAVCGLFVLRASANLVSPALSLEELARRSDLVCKATVVADHAVTDDSFTRQPGFEVHETSLRVVSIVKGSASDVIRFRHYVRNSEPVWYAPHPYTFSPGRSYLIFAQRIEGDTYRPFEQYRGMMNEGVLLALDGKPVRGATITETVWLEELELLRSPVENDVVDAIQQLERLSASPQSDYYREAKDFDRSQTLAALQPLIAARSVVIATAAITAFGRDSPYFNDDDAQFWLAGLGKGHLPGIGPRKRLSSPQAEVGAQELLQVTKVGKTPDLRAIAIRALGRSSHSISASMIAEWLRDPSIAVRRAAVLVSADQPDHDPIVAASTDGWADMRRTAALAIGFSQDQRLIPLLGELLRDRADNVRDAAALSLLSFPLEQAAPVMKANLTSQFGPRFITALAQRDPQLYLAPLARMITQSSQPTDSLVGFIPAGESWDILFDFIKSRPAAELAAGKFDPSLQALESMHWLSSGEPVRLYALYLSRGLVSRAKQFREATRQSAPFDMEVYFDRVDQNPAPYLQ